jgi:REP element-mobilizing transposase RayT
MPKGDRAGMPHEVRAPLASRFPEHVTLRTVDGLSGLRSRACFRAIAGAFRLVRSRQTIRLTEFSVQGNHLHLIVEAADAERLPRGVQGLGISIAKRLNALLGRSGPVFADRYHAHILRTPTEVANAVAYVRGNFAVHAARQGAQPIEAIDRCSSAALIDGRLPDDQVPPLVRPAKTWLLSIGWRRARRFAAQPRGSRPPPLSHRLPRRSTGDPRARTRKPHPQ